MDILAQEITIVIFGCAFFILVSVGIVVLFLVYQKKQLQNRIQKQELQNQFQQELLNTRVEAQEHTLNMVGQEIHDNIGQILSLVKLNMNKVLAENATPSPVLTSTKDLVSKAIHDLRALSKTLNTGYLSNTPLGDSLKFDLALVSQSGSFTTNLQVEGVEPEINPQKKIIIYRMAQELLNNAIKHSKASLIEVFLNFTEGNFNMRIKDNGVGFALPASTDKTVLSKSTGTGLGNLVLRAKLIGADFKIEKSQPNGTTATLNLAL
jgi:two-component system, NarL family, sensor kinase